MLIGKWYKFASVAAYEQFKGRCYSNEQIAAFILKHKYIKVTEICEESDSVLNACTVDGINTEDVDFHFSIDEDEFMLFTEAQVEWKEHEFYKLVNPTGFRNASAINTHIADTIKDNVFIVKKVDSIFNNSRVLSLHVMNKGIGYGPEFKCTITLRELKFFAHCHRDGTIIDDYNDTNPLPPITEEVENNLIIEVDGKITIVVDDEQSRLFAIKSLEGIRFASV